MCAPRLSALGGLQRVPPGCQPWGRLHPVPLGCQPWGGLHPVPPGCCAPQAVGPPVEFFPAQLTQPLPAAVTKKPAKSCPCPASLSLQNGSRATGPPPCNPPPSVGNTPRPVTLTGTSRHQRAQPQTKQAQDPRPAPQCSLPARPPPAGGQRPTPAPREPRGRRDGGQGKAHSLDSGLKALSPHSPAARVTASE